MNNPDKTYAIEFWNGGKLVQRWGGYQTTAAAQSAINDADLIVPFTWRAEIVADT